MLRGKFYLQCSSMFHLILICLFHGLPAYLMLLMFPGFEGLCINRYSSCSCFYKCTLKEILSWPEDTDYHKDCNSREQLAYICIWECLSERKSYFFLNKASLVLFCVDSHEQVWWNCYLHSLLMAEYSGKHLVTMYQTLKNICSLLPSYGTSGNLLKGYINRCC